MHTTTVNRFAGIPRLEDGPGWLVRSTDRCRIELWLLIYGNLRVVEVFPGGRVGRSWCYPIGDAWVEQHVMATLGYALTWDGEEDTEPDGWYREVRSGRRRPGNDPAKEYIHR